MRSARDLWKRLTSFAKLHPAAQKAARGKHACESVLRFRHELGREQCRLQDELRAKAYAPGPYRTFRIHHPKPRLISAAQLRDRVVHHALQRP
jgi:hypothetical protein